MQTPRISASSYSNTAALIWSFLYGSNHGKAEIILDNAPARSAQLLEESRVDAALVPVIAFQTIANVRLVPDVCVGAKTQVRSVCLVTNGKDLENVRSVSLDASSRTSVVLTKMIFREFLGFEPEYKLAEPDLAKMLAESDAALLIGDPALILSVPPAVAGGLTQRKFDLAELWHKYTGFGFVFAMWMTRRDRIALDFASARDEGLSHLDEIAANYRSETGLSKAELFDYLSGNISYSIDESMQKGLELYFSLAHKNGFCERNSELRFV